MNGFKRYYNQNRKKIWSIIIIIASVLVLIYILNWMAKKDNEKQLQNVATTQDTNYNTNTSTLTTNQSTVNGNTVSDTQLKTATETIDKFIEYCNKQDIQSAYDMLTDDCKNQMYNTIDIFKEAYYNQNFNGETKTCSIENWTGSIYKVRLIDDLLSTGKSNNGYAKQDYITVKEIDNNYKLNINSYIGYTSVNKTTTKNNVEVEVVGKHTDMDYEEYTIKVTNNNNDKISSKITLGNRNDVESIYLEDDNESKHTWYNHEITDPMLEVENGRTRELEIKFYSSYTSTKNIKYLVFSDIERPYGQNADTFEIKASV